MGEMRFKIKFRAILKVFFFFFFKRLQKEVCSHRGVEVGDNGVLQTVYTHKSSAPFSMPAGWGGGEGSLGNYYPK